MDCNTRIVISVASARQRCHRRWQTLERRAADYSLRPGSPTCILLFFTKVSLECSEAWSRVACVWWLALHGGAEGAWRLQGLSSTSLPTLLYSSAQQIEKGPWIPGGKFGLHPVGCGKPLCLANGCWDDRLTDTFMETRWFPWGEWIWKEGQESRSWRMGGPDYTVSCCKCKEAEHWKRSLDLSASFCFLGFFL